MLAQFDVHRFLGRGQATAPYLLVVQSNAFRRLDRRLAIPLVLRDALPADLGPLVPVFTLEGRALALAVLDLASYPRRAFGDPVANLAEHGETVLNAIDLALSRGFGA